MWLDSASAALVRLESRFKRPVGPGVHFTEFGEYLAGTHDLHTLVQNIGPDENDEPFTVQKTHESYQKIQERRWATSGTTRDAIEVVASISVISVLNRTQLKAGLFLATTVPTAKRRSAIASPEV
jgi:hypothetical protein